MRILINMVLFFSLVFVFVYYDFDYVAVYFADFVVVVVVVAAAAAAALLPPFLLLLLVEQSLTQQTTASVSLPNPVDVSSSPRAIAGWAFSRRAIKKYLCLLMYLLLSNNLVTRTTIPDDEKSQTSNSRRRRPPPPRGQDERNLTKSALPLSLSVCLRVCVRLFRRRETIRDDELWLIKCVFLSRFVFSVCLCVLCVRVCV